MKSISFLVLMTVLITACSHRQTNDFEFIDFSIYKDRPQEYTSIKIFQDGKVYINSYNGYKYIFTLNESTTDTISALTKSIIDAKFDSVYYTNCLACINFNLVIKSKEGRSQIFHIGDLYLNEEFKLLDDYVCYLNRLVDRSIKSVDSSFKFISRTDRLLPPPPPK